MRTPSSLPHPPPHPLPAHLRPADLASPARALTVSAQAARGPLTRAHGLHQEHGCPCQVACPRAPPRPQTPATFPGDCSALRSPAPPSQPISPRPVHGKTHAKSEPPSSGHQPRVRHLSPCLGSLCSSGGAGQPRPGPPPPAPRAKMPSRPPPPLPSGSRMYSGSCASALQVGHGECPWSTGSGHFIRRRWTRRGFSFWGVL